MLYVFLMFLSDTLKPCELSNTEFLCQDVAEHGYLFGKPIYPDRRIRGVRSGPRHLMGGRKRNASTIRSIFAEAVKPSEVISGMSEMDSHADTVALGRNSIILRYTHRQCEVTPYAETYDSIGNVKIVTGATGYTNKCTGERTILVFNEALWLADHMEHTLINPNQLRSHGCTVQDNPFNPDQPMFLENPDGTFKIPLRSQGTTIGIETWTPTEHDLRTLPRVELTSKTAWDPHRVKFPRSSLSEEEEMAESAEFAKIHATRTISSIQEAHIGDVDDTKENTDDDDPETVLFSLGNINQRFINSVKVQDAPNKEERAAHISQINTKEQDRVNDAQPKLFGTSKKRSAEIDPNQLARSWDISLEKARQTLRVTTQNFTRSAMLPLSRRYRADRFYERPAFRATLYTDTVDAHVKSIEGNKYGQLFTTREWFADIYPMSHKHKAGKGLSSFINEYGVSSLIVSDGGGEQVGKTTTFQELINKHHIRHKVTEASRSNQNRAEDVVRELRRRWFRVMVRKRVPKKLWDYGMKWICKTMQVTAQLAGDADRRK